MQALAPKRTRRQTLVTLREDFFSSPSPRQVDRDQGIIFGVKVLGWESPNRHGIDGVTGTVYAREAVKRALKLYEGVPVNKNHPPRDKPNQERTVGDRIGWLRNPRLSDTGLYADLHLLKSDPDSDKLFEAAETNPALFGMSHNALGKWEIQGGKAVIVELPEVRSVDLVTEGGTTKSLFESREKSMATTRQVSGTKAGAKAGRSHLTEDDMQDDQKKGYMADMAQDAPPPEPVAPAAMNGGSQTDHLLAAIKAALDSGDVEFANKVWGLVKSYSAPAPAADTTEQDESDSEDEPQKKKEEGEEMKTEESLQRENVRLARQLAVLREAIEANIDLTPTREKALMALKESDDRKALLDEFKAVKQPGKPASPAKSSGPIYEQRSNEQDLDQFENFYANGMARLTGCAPGRS